MYKVTGNKLKAAIKTAMLELSTLQSTWDESLYKFEGEEKSSPKETMAQIEALENKIATLQVLQSDYNLRTEVNLSDEKVNLKYCITLVGGAGRISSRWRDAAKGEKLETWQKRGAVTRDKDKAYAELTITKAECLKEAKKAEKHASDLRSAIAEGNIKELEYEDSVAKLFE